MPSSTSGSRSVQPNRRSRLKQAAVEPVGSRQIPPVPLDSVEVLVNQPTFGVARPRLCRHGSPVGSVEKTTDDQANLCPAYDGLASMDNTSNSIVGSGGSSAASCPVIVSCIRRPRSFWEGLQSERPAGKWTCPASVHSIIHPPGGGWLAGIDQPVGRGAGHRSPGPAPAPAAGRHPACRPRRHRADPAAIKAPRSTTKSNCRWAQAIDVACRSGCTSTPAPAPRRRPSLGSCGCGAWRWVQLEREPTR